MDPLQTPICMSCSPRTGLAVLADRSSMVCRTCGEETDLVKRELVLIVGRSGSGKSAVAPVVRELLGAYHRYVVLDTDLMLHVAQFDWTMWLNNWLLLAYGLAQNGVTLVLCGQVDPEKLEHLPARPFVGEFVVLLLDCSAAVRAERLRARPPWRGWTDELIDDELVESQQLRARGYDRFATDAITPERLAAELVDRILRRA